jgi:hypothetical protein
VLSNLPFIHRAYRYTFRSHPELFLPVRHVVYRKSDDNYVWITARVEGRFADGRTLSTLPTQFEVDKGYADHCVIRTRKRVKWYPRLASKDDQRRAQQRLHDYLIRSFASTWFISRPRLTCGTSKETWQERLTFVAIPAP